MRESSKDLACAWEILSTQWMEHLPLLLVLLLVVAILVVVTVVVVLMALIVTICSVTPDLCWFVSAHI